MNTAIKRVVFDKGSIGAIAREIRKWGDVETGGVLLGHVNKDYVQVTRVIDGGPKAIRQSYTFQCDRHYTDMHIDMEYANSKGDCKYLAEWHTHPQKYPVPSEVDLNSLDRLASSSEEFAMLLIVGFIDFTKENFVERTIAIIRYQHADGYFECEIAEASNG